MGKKLQLKLEGFVVPKRGDKKDRAHFKIRKVVWGKQSNAEDKIILIEEILRLLDISR